MPSKMMFAEKVMYGSAVAVMAVSFVIVASDAIQSGCQYIVALATGNPWALAEGLIALVIIGRALSLKEGE